jgi:hypothetical protein
MELNAKSHIFSHRGIWHNDIPNSSSAINKSINLGFSVEIDIREQNGEIVISHDLALNKSVPLFMDFFPNSTRFAINLKSDGLIPLINRNSLEQSDYFFFDGSIPEILKYKHEGFKTAVRLSEYEQQVPWESSIIWLDSFHSDWWLNTKILDSYSEKSEIVIVSPELHGRSPKKVWENIASKIRSGNEKLSICTDFPEEFQKLLL